MPLRRYRLQSYVLALIGALFGWHPIYEPDTFWHLSLGRAVIRHHSRIVPEPSAFRAWSDACVVPQWLWDAFTYGVYQLGGFSAVSLLSVLFGALAGFSVSRLLDAGGGREAQGLAASLGVLALCAVADQLNVRPNLAFFVLLSSFVALALRYRDCTERAAVRAGAALVAIGFLWAQIHASFVLTPALFLLAVLPARVANPSGDRRAALRRDGAVLLGLLSALFSCAGGISVVALVAQHTNGDVVRHVFDMRPFDWTMLAPFAWPIGAVLVLLIVTGAIGLSIEGRIDASAALFFLLGLAMAYTAARFVVAWALLMLPWALCGARAIATLHAERPRRQRAIEAGYALMALLAVAATFRRGDALYGPMFRSGLNPGAFPEAAARYLARLPEGTQAYTEYDGGGPLGFWLDGRVRTFVDGRTLSVFDATDAAIARDTLVDARVLDHTLRRHALTVAVVDRESSSCELMARRFEPVVIEARHTTFAAMPAGGSLPGIKPCGRFFLDDHACDDGGAAAAASVERLAAAADSPFLRFMRASVALECKRGSAEDALASLPAARDARPFLSQYRLYRARALFALGRVKLGLAAVDEALADDDPLAIRVFVDPVAGHVSIADARLRLERGIAQMDDNAPPALRARLALVCMHDRDPECARFHGLRAALRGSLEAVPAVEWAAEHHSSPRVRNDLRHWLTELRTH